MHAHHAALLQAAGEKRAEAAAKREELRALSAAAGKLLAAQKGFDASGEATRQLVQPAAAVRADLLRTAAG